MHALSHHKHQFELLREDFPILKHVNRNKPLIYLDNGASAQKPYQVIKAIQNVYEKQYANIHRGVYELSEQTTLHYDKARKAVKGFINAKSQHEIVFVRGTTEAINLVAHSFGRTHFKAGDEIILSEMEHHANIVPWYNLKKELGIELKIIPVTADGLLDMAAYETLLSAKTKLVAVTHVSNVLGTINPVKEIVEIAHAHHVPVLLDGAQAVPHIAVDVQAIDCDFYAFSSHKLYGPSGIGILYGKQSLLENMPPYQGGGDMIETVAFDEITFAPSPQKFEAGTPNIEGAIGLHAAISYLSKIGMQEIFDHEQALLKFATEKLTAIDGLKIIGNAKNKVGVLSFVIENIHPHDIASVVDHEGIAVRAGHHCAMPLMQRFNVPATVRASLGLFNNEADILALVEALKLTKRLFA